MRRPRAVQEKMPPRKAGIQTSALSGAGYAIAMISSS
jgi:hypothetical protein